MKQELLDPIQEHVCIALAWELIEEFFTVRNRPDRRRLLFTLVGYAIVGILLAVILTTDMGTTTSTEGMLIGRIDEVV